MSQYNYDEKPKNDFEKPKNAIRERGGCLSLFLVFIIALNVFFLFSFCAQASQLSRLNSGAMPILAVAFAVQSGVVACAVAVWNWKKWGYYGLCAVYALEIVVMLCSGNFVGIGSAVVGLGILVTLVNNRIEMFD